MAAPKQKTLAEAKERIQQSCPDLPGKRVIEVLESIYKGPKTVFSAATLFDRMAGANKDSVFMTLSILASDGFRIIEPHWYFVDELHEMHEITESEVQEAIRSGKFFRPDTGEEVPNFRSSIGVRYLTSSAFDKPKHGRQP